MNTVSAKAGSNIISKDCTWCSRTGGAVHAVQLHTRCHGYLHRECNGILCHWVYGLQAAPLAVCTHLGANNESSAFRDVGWRQQRNETFSLGLPIVSMSKSCYNFQATTKKNIGKYYNQAKVADESFECFFAVQLLIIKKKLYIRRMIFYFRALVFKI